ncbi:hypothetical protein BC830DRAFT_529314 [Chytriomyces sp. MP71]|nr:hypothetical protein BC830DRAFT_529314 [Chytriomyces sp. MP71]
MNYGTSNLNGDESTNLTHGLQPFQDASAPDKQRKPQVKSLPPLPIKTNGDDAIPDTESDQTLSLKQAEEEALIANKKLHFQGSSHARFTVVPRTLDPSGPDPIQMAQNLLAASTAQVMSTAGSQFMLTSTPKVTLSGAPQYVRTSQSPALHHNPPAHYVSGNEERSNASMKNVEAAQISDHGYSDTNENQKKTKQKTKQDDSTDEQQICVDVSSFGSKGTLKMESEKTHEASTPSTSSSNLARHQITSSRQTVPKPKTPNLPRQLTHQKISFVSHAETDLSFQKNEQAASPSHSELNINMKKAVCLEESRENPIISEEVTLFQKPKDDLKPVDFLVSNTPIRPLSPEPPPEESKHEAKQNNDFPVVPAHKLPVLKSPRVIRIEKVQHYEKFRLTVKNVKRNEEPLPEVSNLEELEKEFITDFAFLENRENAKIRNQINERRRDINAEMRMPVIDRDLTQEILGLMSHHPHVLPQELKLLLQKRTNTLNLKMTFKQLRRLSHASDDYPEPMYRQIARLFAPLVFDTPICEGSEKEKKESESNAGVDESWIQATDIST